jgi:hypothetical protein
MSGLPANMDCSLVGSDKKEGTVPMHVIPFSNKAFAYIISSTLFIGLLSIIWLSSLKIPQYKVPKIYNFIGYVSIFILMISLKLFSIGDGNHPYELFFGIIGIFLSCIAIYLTIDINTIRDFVSNIGNGLNIVWGGLYYFFANMLTLLYVVLYLVFAKIWKLFWETLVGIGKFLSYMSNCLFKMVTFKDFMNKVQKGFSSASYWFLYLIVGILVGIPVGILALILCIIAIPFVLLFLILKMLVELFKSDNFANGIACLIGACFLTGFIVLLYMFYKYAMNHPTIRIICIVVLVIIFFIFGFNTFVFV